MGMRFYCDEEDNILTGSAGVREPLDKAVFRYKNTQSVEIQFFRNGAVYSRPPGSTGKFGLKVKGQYSADPLVEATSWTKVEDDGAVYYRFTPDFGGEALGALLTASSVGYVDLMMEFEWTDGENVGSTVPSGNTEVLARVWNEINTTESDPPTPGPDPYPTSEKLILHYDGVTGWTGADSLEEIPTVAMPTGRLIAFVLSGETTFAKLIASTHVTATSSNPIYVRPTDYATTTNERVWISYDPVDPETDVVHCDPDVDDLTALVAITTVGVADYYTTLIRGTDDHYVLMPGTAATVSPWVLRPTDYATTTNERVWVKQLAPLETDNTLVDLMGGASGDLDRIPTLFMTAGQMMALTGGPVSALYRLETKAYSAVTILSVSGDAIFTAGVLPTLNSVVEFFTSGTLPSGLTALSYWYVVEVNDGPNSFKVSATHGGSVQAITTSGTGTHTFISHEDPWWVRPRDHATSGKAWKLAGPETVLTFEAIDKATSLTAGRHYCGFSPVSMLPHRVQFDLAAGLGATVTAGVEADQTELIDGGNVSWTNRSSDTDELSETVNGRIFIGDEIIADIATPGGASGLIIHIAGVVAPILGPTIGNQTEDSEISALVANANADQTVSEGATVTLSAAGSTANDSPVSYAWTQTSGPSVTILNSTTASPSFVAPLVSGDTDLIFLLTVTNSATSATATDSVTITVEDFALVAVAGPDQTVDVGDVVTLTAAGSTALLAGVVEYEWEQIWGPTVVLSSAFVASPTFTAPSDARVYSFQLHVISVSTGASATDNVAIDVVDPTGYSLIPTTEIPICADRNDARVLIGCENGIIYTSDDIIEFFRIDTGTGLDINGIATRPDGRAVMVTDAGIYYSRNGITWIDSTPTAAATVSVEYEVIAGGGGGGSGGAIGGGGGGGAGGRKTATGFSLSTTTSHTITVGDGGVGGVSGGGAGATGSDSVFSSITSAGGGGGGETAGVTGGSGGGGGSGYGYGGGSATGSQGYAGGAAADAPYLAGGGGGGAGGAGATPGATDVGADGGSGVSSSITGSSVTRAGGGGGAGSSGSGSGGSGGGGAGGSGGTNGTANTGGGGGGSYSSTAGGDGGSGIVIVKYLGSAVFTGGTITTSGGYTIHSFTSSGTLAPTTEANWEAVADSGTVFIAAGNDGRVARSSNGVSWTETVINAAYDWAYIATDGESKFLVATASGGYMGYSSDGGVSWATVSSASSLGMAYSPSLNRWALTGANRLASFPGASFGSGMIAALSTNAAASATYRDVDWDSVNAVFLAVGDGVAKKSYDGLTWTSVYADLGDFGDSTGLTNLLGRFVIASTDLTSIVVAPALPA